MDEAERHETKHRWIVRLVIAVVLGTMLGFTVGYVVRPVAANRLPSAPSLISTLTKPFPVPGGAKVLADISGDHGAGGGTITWTHSVVLDVTGMTPKQMEDIPEFYTAYLTREIPALGEKRGWQNSMPFEWGTQGLYRHASDGTYGVIGNGAWSWRRRTRSVGEHLFCEVYTEVMDFDIDVPKSSSQNPWYVHKGVLELDTPVRGQRVMYVCFAFVANGISGSTAWPGR